MRIVSLGFALPNPQVDNHSIANAPSLFEYDACVIDVRALSRQIEEICAGSGEFRTPEGAPVQPGATGAFHYGLGELLQQRRDELARLVQRGGIIAVLTYPNVPHTAVSTLPGLDRYYVLPAAPGVAYRPPQLVPGDGRHIRTVDPAHPWSVYLDDLRNKLRYRAHWNLDPDTTADSGTARVIARSDGGAVVGVDFKVADGHVVFLPPPGADLTGAQRKPLTDAVVESIERALEDRGDERPPNWLRNYPLPGLTEAQAAAEQAEQAFAESESALVEARAHLTDAAKFHGLLWRAGRFSLEPLVRDAFRQLGFDVPTALERPPELRDGDDVALLEIDASAGPVSERPYLTLQRRIEEDFLQSGQRRKGVIVVNGERHADPARRRDPLSDTLINACDNFGYALITGDALFALVTYALEGADADTLAAIRETILTTDGRLHVEESEDAEPPDDAAAGSGNGADAAIEAAVPDPPPTEPDGEPEPVPAAGDDDER